MSNYIRRVRLKGGRFRYYPIFNGHSLGGYYRKKDAEARLARAIAEEAAGGLMQDMLFRDWVAKWLCQVKTRIKESTFESYESGMRVHLLPVFGDISLQNLRTSDIEDWKVEASKEMHPRTLNKTLTILGTCLNDAVWQGRMNLNVAEKVRHVKEHKSEMQFLNTDEVRRLLDFDCEISPLIATSLLSGIRQGELLALRWKDIDLESGTIHISRSYRKGRFTEPKTPAARRAVSIPSKLKETLCPLEGRDDELCFSTDGKPWSSSVLLQGYFYPALKKAEVKKVRWHDLRHTYAALMISVNAPIKWLQRQLGHTSIQTTLDLYGHLFPEAGSKTITRFDGLF